MYDRASVSGLRSTTVGKSNETTMLTGFSERQDVLELVSELKDCLGLD